MAFFVYNRSEFLNRLLGDHNVTTISNVVLVTVHVGPPRLTKSRTFTLTLVLDL